MMKAIRASMEGVDEQNHIRIVCFMTDGYVGNEAEIIAEIRKHPNARVFSFGIGSSVNRYLLDKMAEYGRGEVEYVTLKDDGSAAAKRFHERVQNPLLTDISVEWAGLPVADVYPRIIPDLFSAKPLVLTARYTGAAKGTLRIKGKVAGRPWTRDIAVSLPESEPKHDVLATLWARTKVDDLMHRSMGPNYGAFDEPGPSREDAKEQIVKIGLDFKLMTQFTSFVAVEETIVTEGGQPRRVDVPVEMPAGVDHRGVFGETATAQPVAMNSAAPMRFRAHMEAGAIGSRLAKEEDKLSDVRRQSVPPPVAMPEGRRDVPAAPIAKLHPSLVGPGVMRLAVNGKLEVQITLTDTSETTMAELKKRGFEVVTMPKAGKIVIGRIAPDKLGQLTQMAAVTYIAPVQR
jgi:Ca-activated chloride channel family protein